MVGITEDNANTSDIKYYLRYSYYRDITRGKIMTDQDNGFLKMIVQRETKVILGHIIRKYSYRAHPLWNVIVKDKKTLDEVIATVFNYPSFHDLYKYAVCDAPGNLAGKKSKKGVKF